MKAAIFFFLLVGTVWYTEAHVEEGSILCFTCSGELEACLKTKGQKCTGSCMKKEKPGGETSNATTYKRDCFTPQQPTNCTTDTDGLMVCYCNSDLCNDAYAISPSSLLGFSLLAAARGLFP